nr:MAG TPA: hypothetical protein [Caudoviricetes sp.]
MYTRHNHRLRCNPRKACLILPNAYPWFLDQSESPPILYHAAHCRNI